ncbi:MAG: hypothetical protein MRY83_19290 [Flavobacteriales bacterium]|nr:hypothetical protein [Flavobacteriales bacterium]
MKNHSPYYDWFGVDYGSKLAGTTVICFLKNEKLVFVQSEKKKSADVMIEKFVKSNQYSSVFMDAPLSLPGVYTKHTGSKDFFYREADKILAAMSPMFLGGLTARAMRLKHTLDKIEFIETYPAHLFKEILKVPSYKMDLIEANKALKDLLPFSFDNPENWHQFDALGAWISGWRHHNEKSEIIGSKQEGEIVI